MIPPIDITHATRDSPNLWRRMTGERVDAATAHMRSGQVITVTGFARRPLSMCRAGACIFITPQAVEAEDDGLSALIAATSTYSRQEPT